ncbi:MULTISPECIES: YfhO family protein [unclassified Luteococcus]|uniref:YfhO family protein n=1 Tax=unclassified Luteococcus TaxID=2639923 RepID=UPI00313C1C85
MTTHTLHRVAPPGLAALLAGLIHLAVLRSSHLWPLGTRSRAMGDFGTQYLPFHHALAELLHGNPMIGPEFNWFSGAGVGFLPDYVTYLASPLNVVLAVVPARHVDLAVALLVLLKVMLAAAAMTGLLTRLTPRSAWWPAVFLGAGYASSAWVFELGVFTPMWLDGLIGFPLLCLAARWTVERRRPIGAAFLVALVWWANFYSAYMASLGAGLFLLTWLASTASGWRTALGSLGRLIMTGFLGVLLDAVLLLPTALAVGRGIPYPTAPLEPLPQQAIWSRILPFTEGVASTPMIFTGTVTVILAASLVVPHGLRLRESLPWPLALGAMVASMQVPAVVMVWNLFDTPNGNPFRYSFVICGFMAITAMLGLQQGSLRDAATRTVSPKPLALVPGTCLVLWLAARVDDVGVHNLYVDSRLAMGWSICLAVGLGIVALPHRWPRGEAVVAGMLALACTAEMVACAGFVDEHSRRFLAVAPLEDAVTAKRTERAAQATVKAGWPTGRVGGAPAPGQTYLTALNEPLTLKYPSLPYYSSTINGDVAKTLTGLGKPQRAGRRMVLDRSDPALDALLAVTVRAADPQFGRVAHQKAFPMVRVLVSPTPEVDENPVAPLAPVLARRNALLESAVFAPTQSIAFPTPAVLGQHPVAAGAEIDISARCAPGQTLYLLTERVDATASWTTPAGERRRIGLQDRRVTPLTGLSSGTIHLGNIRRDALISSNALACLDDESLRRQVSQAVAPRIQIARSRLSATFPEEVTGDIVVATAAQAGWSCRLDGRSTPVTARSGLLRVHAEAASELQCRYRTPGLVPGALASLVALIGILSRGPSPLRSQFAASRRR